MQPLDQALRRAGTQHRHQANGLFRLPDKLYRLIFELLPETVAVQRVATHARPYQRHERQPFTQAQLARQRGVFQQFERAANHF